MKQMINICSFGFFKNNLCLITMIIASLVVQFLVRPYSHSLTLYIDDLI